MKLKIGWLFPHLLSTYGDRGNVQCLQRRMEWRKIECQVLYIDAETPLHLWKDCDLYVGGGAQDREQGIVMKVLKGKRGEILKYNLENGTPGIFTCAFFQLLGKSYKTSNRTTIEGLSLLDFYTVQSNQERAIGNSVIKITAERLQKDLKTMCGTVPHLIGFENHAGATYLNGLEPLGAVIKGHGNNSEDATEGVFYANMIGSYLHGPILPKNPFLADWLIHKAISRKYQTTTPLSPLDDFYVTKARAPWLKDLK